VHRSAGEGDARTKVLRVQAIRNFNTGIVHRVSVLLHRLLISRVLSTAAQAIRGGWFAASPLRGALRPHVRPPGRIRDGSALASAFAKARAEPSDRLGPKTLAAPQLARARERST
jgi:hypothetical protein